MKLIVSDSLAPREYSSAFWRIGHHVIEKRCLTEPLHLIAALCRLGMNLNCHVWELASSLAQMDVLSVLPIKKNFPPV